MNRRKLSVAATLAALCLTPTLARADESPAGEPSAAFEEIVGDAKSPASLASAAESFGQDFGADEEAAAVDESILELLGGDDTSSAPVQPISDDVSAPVVAVAAPATQPAGEATSLPLAVSTPATPVVAAHPTTRPSDAVKSMLETPLQDGKLNLLVGRSTVLKAKDALHRVNLTQPDVVSDNLVDANSLLLTAKKVGSTQLIIWNENEQSEVVDVNVDVDLNALTDLVKKNFPNADVQLSAVNGTLIARGHVSNLQTAEQITEMLSAYGKVLNFLELSGGQQVMLQVRFAEVSRSATTALGVNFGFSDGASHFGNNVPGGGPFSVADGVGNLNRSIGGNVTLFGGGSIGSTAFDVMLSALRNNNLLRVLAEPNLSTTSGKEAQFLAGGKFPIPVPQSGGAGNAAITVEYKEFGIRLTFTPVVLGDGKIRLEGMAEVSDLDYSKSVTLGGFNIPSITTRNVKTTIDLNEGQTFAVAGLLNNRMTANKSAVPLLGDIPVLGALFRSVRYERSETELVILVTPRMVSAMNPAQVPEMPGERWNYPSESDLFLKQYMGGPGAQAIDENKRSPVMYRGPYGFVPANSGSVRTSDAGQRVTGIDPGE